MQIRHALGTGLVLLLVLALAVPVGAKPKRVDVRGIIVSLDVQGRSFLLQERRGGADRIWVVRLHPNVDIEGVRRNRGDDDDDDEDKDRKRGSRRFIRGLQVGDVVEVEGQVLGNGQILAREIEVIGHRTVQFSPIVLQPPSRRVNFPNAAGGPCPLTPVIFSPQSGSQITAPEFTITGRACPGARVHIEVTGDTGFFQIPVARADVTANEQGFFAYTVRPAVQIPGAVYRFTVTATYQGVTSPPIEIRGVHR